MFKFDIKDFDWKRSLPKLALRSVVGATVNYGTSKLFDAVFEDEWDEMELKDKAAIKTTQFAVAYSAQEVTGSFTDSFINEICDSFEATDAPKDPIIVDGEVIDSEETDQ